jgi:CubicO group peptidase (beta-lactamase class C family)
MSERPIDRAPLDQLVNDFAAERHCPTIAWGVVRSSGLALTGAVGDVDERTVYRIASMTKSFSAAATLLLRDEGAFQLDDPIGRHVPELDSLRSPTGDAPPITIRDLLSMTSGLVTDDDWADRHLDLTDDEFDAIITSGPIFAQPTGLEYEYSNFGYAVLGRVVHRVSGRPIQAHVTDRLLGPLGMTRTTWVQPDHDGWARPLRWLDGDYVEELPPLADGLIAPMGGLWTTVSDLARWVGWLDAAFPARDDPDDGPLQRSSRREMQTSQRSTGIRERNDSSYATSYGYGLRVLHQGQRGAVVSHSGGLPGYGSNMSWRLGRRLGVIALSNATYAPMTELGLHMLDVLSDQIDPAPHDRPANGRLHHAAGRLVSLLNDWDDTDAARLFADNVELDDAWSRRRSAASIYRPLTITSVDSINEARAQISCTARDGQTVQITFALAPVAPPTIQRYDISPLRSAL